MLNMMQYEYKNLLLVWPQGSEPGSNLLKILINTDTLYIYHLAVGNSSHKCKLNNKRKMLFINENTTVWFYATLAKQTDMLTSQEQLISVLVSVSGNLSALTRKGMQHNASPTTLHNTHTQSL